MRALYLTLILYYYSNFINSDENVDVKLPLGQLIGKRKVVLEKKVDVYLGIPFAKPPVGPLRFKRPEPIENYDEPIEAFEPTPWCYNIFLTANDSRIPKDMNEDCLYLNIWAPVSSKISSYSPPKTVMVWIHGGSFLRGSAQFEVYNGEVLASSSDVIVASINYRLGALGFLNAGTPEESGNLGLYDQNLALQWIRNFIGYFGGDSSKITVFGHSAGAMSIGFHLISPLSKGLFKRAILQSGSPAAPLPLLEYKQSISLTHKLAELLGCNSTSIWKNPDIVLNCLRRKEATDVVQAEVNIYRKQLLQNEFKIFSPILGEKFIPLAHKIPFDPSHFNDHDIMIGVTKDEGSVFLSKFLQNFEAESQNYTVSLALKNLGLWFEKMANVYDSTNLIKEYFKDIGETDSEDILIAMGRFVGDWLFNCPAIYFAETFSSRQNKVSFYIDTYRSGTTSHFYPNWTGVVHGEEIPYVFGYLLRNGDWPFKPEEIKFSKHMMELWTSFAKDGHPSSSRHYYWPLYSLSRPYYLELNPNSVKYDIIPYNDLCQGVWKDAYFDPDLMMTMRSRKNSIKNKLRADEDLSRCGM